MIYRIYIIDDGLVVMIIVGGLDLKDCLICFWRMRKNRIILLIVFIFDVKVLLMNFLGDGYIVVLEIIDVVFFVFVREMNREI